MAIAALNKFARFYGAEILRRSGANSRLGDLYDWAGIFNNRLTPVDDNLINWVEADAAAREALRKQVDEAPTFPASFAEVIDLTSSLTVGVKPDLPNIPQQLAADLTNKTVLNFHFEGVVLRPMPDELGIRLRFLLDQYKTTHFDQYKQHLRPYDLAASLFYAQRVVLKLDHSFQLSASAESEVKALGGSVQVSGDGHQNLAFNQPSCPFAVGLKPVHTY